VNLVFYVNVSKITYFQHKLLLKKTIASHDGHITLTKMNSQQAVTSTAASAPHMQVSGSQGSSRTLPLTLIPEKCYLAIQKIEKGRDSLENYTSMKLTHYLDRFQRKIPSADAQLINYISLTELRNKVWWQISRDDSGRVPLIAFKAWIAKFEPLYLSSFEVALKLHLHPKNFLVSEADLQPHFVNLIFAKLCVDTSCKLLQPREMRRMLLDMTGAQNSVTLYPLLLEFSGLEDAEIPDEGPYDDLTIEGMIICADFVTELETYFHKRTEGELGSMSREIVQNLAMKASLNWFSEEQDDVDARRFATFAGQSKKGIVSESSETRQSNVDDSSSEDSDEPDARKIKDFDLKSFSAASEMRDLMASTTNPVQPNSASSANAKTKVAAGESLSKREMGPNKASLSSDENLALGLQMHKKVEWEQALYAYSEFCQRNSCGHLRFLVEHGMTTICHGASQQISALGFEGMDVLFSVSNFMHVVFLFVVFL
jgi:hypothetical protein